jgi:hypothetical protein
MSKLNKIKAELAKLLLTYSAIKTDKAVIEYQGEELAEGMEVYITDENGEKIAVEDGDYTTEDNKVITVKDGKVDTIVEIEETVEAVEEEVIEDETIDKQEEVVEEQPTDTVVEEQPTEEPTEEPTVETEDEVKLEDVNAEIENIHKEINELYKIVDSLLKKVGETRDEADARLKKLECTSQAKPAVEEFEQVTKVSKGDSKLDKFLSRYGN